MAETVDRRYGNIAPVSGVPCLIRLPDEVDRPLRPSVQGLWFGVKLPSATDVDVVRTPWTIIPGEDEDEGRQWRSQQIWGAQADWLADGVTQGGLPGNRWLDDGKGIRRFNGCSPGSPGSRPWGFAMCGISSMVMDHGPNSKDFILIKAKECCMDRPFLNKTSSILVSESVRIPPSGGYEQLVEPMIALRIGFEGLSTPAAESSSVDTVPNSVLFLDSGAGCHMVSHAALLMNPRDPPAGMNRVRAADGSLLPVVGYGDIQMEGFNIPDVCLVRGLEFNVISVGQLASSHNIGSLFFGDQCNLILPDGSLIGGAFRRNDNQYILRFLEIP